MNSPDLTQIHQVLASLAYAALLGLIGALATWGKSQVDRMQNATAKRLAGDALDDVDNLARQGAAFAYQWAQQNNLAIDHPAIRNAVLAQGTAYAAQVGPQILISAGVTPDVIRMKVLAEFGKLLSADPNTSIANGPPPVGKAPSPILAPSVTLGASIGLGIEAGAVAAAGGPAAPAASAPEPGLGPAPAGAVAAVLVPSDPAALASAPAAAAA